MTEFTKGKWEAAPDGSVILPNGKWYLPCRTLDSNAETTANARLIAAAPDMYDELYEVLQLLKGKSSYNGDEFSQQADSIQELFERIHGMEEI